jgi:hypothetical protein
MAPDLAIKGSAARDDSCGPKEKPRSELPPDFDSTIAAAKRWCIFDCRRRWFEKCAKSSASAINHQSYRNVRSRWNMKRVQGYGPSSLIQIANGRICLFWKAIHVSSVELIWWLLNLGSMSVNNSSISYGKDLTLEDEKKSMGGICARSPLLLGSEPTPTYSLVDWMYWPPAAGRRRRLPWRAGTCCKHMADIIDIETVSNTVDVTYWYELYKVPEGRTILAPDFLLWAQDPFC